MLTDNQNATVRLNYLDDDTLSLVQEELVNPRSVFHRHFLTIAALPEAPLAVFYHLVEIPVTRTRRIAVGHFLQRIADHRIETAARGTHKKLAVLPLQDRVHTRGDTFRKRNVRKAVGGIVVTRKSQTRSYPQLPLLVAVEACHDIAGQCRRVGRIRQVGRKAIAVELVQSVFSGYPHIAILILTDIIDQTARKTFRRQELSSLS